LDKGHKSLEEYSIKSNDLFTMDFQSKLTRQPSAKAKPEKRERKPKEEQKVALTYTIKDARNPLSNTIEVPKTMKIKQLKKTILAEIGLEG
jgi:hypothetical protein